MSIGLLADTKRTFLDVHFWVNAHRCAPGPLLSCTSSRTISDGSHGKVIFTPVPSWANRPWQMSQVACCCPVSRRPGAVGCALVPRGLEALWGCTGALPAVRMLQLYLLAPAPLPISLPIACASPSLLRRGFLQAFQL